jgi:hypothetical protein
VLATQDVYTRQPGPVQQLFAIREEAGPAEVAAALLRAVISLGVHEMSEWVKVDGRWAADPHHARPDAWCREGQR